MYTPIHNRETDRNKILAFMREFNFATLVTSRDDNLKATHLPFLVEMRADTIVLASHLAQANDQWRDFDEGEGMVIFQEPHAFISPRYYERVLSVPTWNYVAVHAYGNATILEAPEEKIALLERLIQLTDPDYLAQFKNLPPEFVAGKLNGIVAFELAVTRLDARFKLSQDRTDKERENIVRALTGAPDGVAARIGEMMRENLKPG